MSYTTTVPTRTHRPRHAAPQRPALGEGTFPGQATTAAARALATALAAAGYTPARVSDGATVRARGGFLIHRDTGQEAAPEQWWVTNVTRDRFGAPDPDVHRWAAVARDAGWFVAPIEPDTVTPTGFLALPPQDHTPAA